MKKTTTLNLHYLLYILFVSLSSYGQITTIYEDFNEITEGNNTSNTGSSTIWTGNANFPEAGNLRVYQAGGAVRIGTGTNTGYITTTPLDLSQNEGNVNVMFDVKGWTAVEGDIVVSLITPTATTQQIVDYANVLADPFETKMVSFTGGEANSSIRIETTAKRAFIDNVIITTECPDVEEPEAEAQSFCGSATIAELVPAGDGIQWYSSETGGIPLSSSDAIATGVYYVSQLVGNCESELVPVSVTVNAIPSAPDVQPQTVCNLSTINDLAANGSGIQWYVSESGGEPLAPGDEVATATYYVSQTVNGCESERVPANITVTTVGPPQAVPQTFCNGAIVDNLVAEGTLVLWYTSPEATVPLDPADLIIEGTYYASQTVDGCESERVSVLVSITEVPAPQGETAQQFTAGQTIGDLAVSGNNILWFSNSGLTSQISSDTPLVNGTTYYAVAVEGDCFSTPLAVTVQESLGQKVYTAENVKYYPNPVTSILTIENNSAIASVVITSILGQSIKTIATNNETVRVDVSMLPAGIYILRINAVDSQAAITIMKQ